MSVCTLQLAPTLRLSDEQLLAIAQANEAWRLEVSATGELIVMAPTGGETGIYNSGVTAKLYNWNDRLQLGLVFDSSTLFRLPTGARRGPDAAWVRRDRWDALSPNDRQRFPPLCPDFVIELRSPSDSPEELRAKMQEYLAAGLVLGWLIDPIACQVEIYRPQQPVEVVTFDRTSPPTVSGDPLLPGFQLDLAKVLVV